MGVPNVRPAKTDDAPALADVHVRAWRAAYRGVMPDEAVDRLTVEERLGLWNTWLAQDAPALVGVADDGSVAGFAVTGAEHDGAFGRPPLGPSERGRGELWVINVAPEHWGRGVGPVLLDAATEQLRRQGYDRAVLWVVEGNGRARRFYEKAGWQADGAELFDPENQVKEVRYHRTL